MFFSCTRFHDFLSIDSEEAQMIKDMDHMYSKGSRMASEVIYLLLVCLLRSSCVSNLAFVLSLAVLPKNSGAASRNPATKTPSVSPTNSRNT